MHILLYAEDVELMSKLEKAIIASRLPLPEYGLTPEASKATRIVDTGIPSFRDRDLEVQIDKTLERSVSKDLLETVRNTFREAQNKK